MDYKKRSGKKSQMALEFLMTYGWAILGSLAAIGVLSYIVISNPSNATPNRCTFPAGFQCMGTQYSGGQLSLKIRNTLGQSIYSVRAVAEDGSFNCSASPSSCADDCVILVTCNTTLVQTSQGSKLSINLLYKRSTSGYDQVAQGDVYQKVG